MPRTVIATSRPKAVASIDELDLTADLATSFTGARPEVVHSYPQKAAHGQGRGRGGRA